MEKKSETLDAVDLGILRLLQADALMTTKELGQKLGLTTTPIYERLRRLEKEGYVQQYTALLDRRRVGLSLLVFCDVSLREHNREYLLQFETEIAALPEVLECHHIAGAYDYLMKVAVRDIDDYQRFVKEKLAGLENIGRVQSHFVMTEVKNTTQLPV